MKEIYGKKSFFEITRKPKQLAPINGLKLDSNFIFVYFIAIIVTKQYNK